MTIKFGATLQMSVKSYGYTYGGTEEQLSLSLFFLHSFENLGSDLGV